MTYDKQNIKLIGVLAGKQEYYDRHIAAQEPDAETKFIRISREQDLIGRSFSEIQHATNWFQTIFNPIDLQQKAFKRLIKKKEL